MSFALLVTTEQNLSLSAGLYLMVIYWLIHLYVVLHILCLAQTTPYQTVIHL